LEELPEQLAEAIRGAAWVAEPTIEFRSTLHINLQEARASKAVLKRVVGRSLESDRSISGSDSGVVVGAWAKGRSSSVQLN
jgi:hypothetical protein